MNEAEVERMLFKVYESRRAIVRQFIDHLKRQCAAVGLDGLAVIATDEDLEQAAESFQ